MSPKHSLLSVILALLTTGLFAQQNPVKNVIRVKFRESFASRVSQSLFTRTADNYVQVGVPSIDVLNARCGALTFKRIFSDGGKYAKRRRAFGLHLWYEITFDADKSPGIQQLIVDYAQNKSFQRVEQLREKQLDYIPKNNFTQLKTDIRGGMSYTYPGLNSTPDDPRYREQWHYHNTGQSGGTVDADIDLQEAWEIQRGSDQVIVSIHDRGIDVDHIDLAKNMWTNTAELNGVAGVDDDGNGYIDDIHGYNLADNTSNILPDRHGTHVAGTIAAVSNNGIGVSGIAGGSGTGDGVRLMSCQILTDTPGTTGWAESYAYAADNGAVISQNSWRYPEPGVYEQSVLDGIDYFIAHAGYDAEGNPVGPMQGGIVIFAAGNSHTDEECYPAYYDPVLAVASTDHNDVKASYSNYGAWVDISAPGGVVNLGINDARGVLSTLPNDTYGFLQGTSMACPHVSGIVALIVSQFGGSGFTPDQVRSRLMENADNIDAGNPSFAGLLGAGRVNAYASLVTDVGIPPDRVTDLSAVEISQDRLKLTWTAPGDKDNVLSGSYEIRMSNTPIDDNNFELARLVATEAARSAGTMELRLITGLMPVTQYFFALRSDDFFGNTSTISNVVSVITSDLSDIEVSPPNLEVSLFTGETSVQQFDITNTGDGILEYSLETATDSEVLLSKAGSNKLLSESVSKLQDDLNALSGFYEDITSLIPGKYLFSGGFSGTNISDGGNDMYDRGNILSTNLGDFIPYTNNQLSNSSAFNDAAYFTAKFPGLFVLGADLAQGVNYFRITGNLGADRRGSMDTSVLRMEKGEKSYVAFVKRVYDTEDPSINHMIVVEDNGTVNHKFATSTDNDYHEISNLSDISRIYYLLYAGYAGENARYIDNNTTGSIMSAFIEVIDKDPNLYLEKLNGEIATGQTESINVLFNARDTDPDMYLNDIIISSNALSDPLVTLSTTLTVTSAPNIQITPENLDFGDKYINTTDSLFFTVKNTGDETLNITDLIFTKEEYKVNVDRVSLDPSQSALIGISFNPLFPGSISDTLCVTSNDPNNGLIQLPVSGNGLIPPALTLSEDAFVENLDTGETSEQLLVVSNQGRSDLVVELKLDSENFSGPHSITDGVTSGFLGWNFGLRKMTPENSIQVVIENQADFSLEIEDFFIFPWGRGVLNMGQVDFDSSPVPVVGYSRGVTVEEGDVLVVITRKERFAKILIDEIGTEGISFYQIYPVASQEDINGLLAVGNEIDLDLGLLQGPRVARVSPGANDWLSFEPEKAIITPGSSQEITLSFDAHGLFGATYSDSLALHSNDPQKPVIKIPVTLEVCGDGSSNPSIVVNPTDDATMTLTDEKIRIDLKDVFVSDEKLTWNVYADPTGLVELALNEDILSLRPIGPGTVNITIEAFDNHCDNANDTFNLNITEVTSLDLLSVNDVMIYPNPTDHSLNITSGSITFSGDDVSIWSLHGKRIYSHHVQAGANTTVLDVSHFDRGIYFLNLPLVSRNVQLRFIVMH
ncbi:S8 family serine peptidase [Fulvivirga sp. M361]|uniref:S8 family serine peptidase n=1 Tax=Fulvivirga sp. M361 TaxID=2594266 RepID=UPI00117B3472|nr:S8 family serine peptidase [Fulvivirga sp. M361]TRX50015.1 S8 family serine peptidase [Fulvivirga sp. M361]